MFVQSLLHTSFVKNIPSMLKVKASKLSALRIPFDAIIPNQPLHTRLNNGTRNYSYYKNIALTASAVAAGYWYSTKARAPIDIIQESNRSQTTIYKFKPLSLSLREKTDEEPPIQYCIPDKDLYGWGGVDEVKESVADLVRYLQDPNEFTKNGAKPPKGVILSGPPGVGKSFLAEAVAGHAGVPLIQVNGGEIEGIFGGEAEKRIREVFKKAEEIAPCVVLLDEIDSIAGKRIESSHNPTYAHHINNKVNQMLTLLSKERTGVVIIATTNRFESLDPAIVRPGRFDRHIALTLPNLNERFDILKIHASGKNISPDVSLDDLAAISSGFSGAKLAAWVNEAAILASRQQVDVINDKHFDTARSSLEIGVARPSSASPEQKRLTATHEAGHAIVGLILGQRVYKISLRETGKTWGFTEWLPLDKNGNLSRQDLLDLICVNLAGRAAELILEMPQTGCENDLNNAKQIAAKMVRDEAMGTSISGLPIDIEIILQEQMDRAQNILKDNKTTWNRIIDNLIEHDELTRSEFHDVINGKNIAKRPQIPQTSKRILQLPPKKASVKQESASTNEMNKTNSAEDTYNLTVEEVANALNVTPKTIRKIAVSSLAGMYEIYFVRELTEEQLTNISKELSENNIKNHLYRSVHEIDINLDNAKDFIKFVRKKN